MYHTHIFECFPPQKKVGIFRCFSTKFHDMSQHHVLSPEFSVCHKLQLGTSSESLGGGAFWPELRSKLQGFSAVNDEQVKEGKSSHLAKKSCNTTIGTQRSRILEVLSLDPKKCLNFWSLPKLSHGTQGCPTFWTSD